MAGRSSRGAKVHLMYDWYRDAACKDSFDHRFHGTPTEQNEVRQLYCIDCPVKVECLASAGVASERYGLWGGQRRTVRSGRG